MKYDLFGYDLEEFFLYVDLNQKAVALLTSLLHQLIRVLAITRRKCQRSMVIVIGKRWVEKRRNRDMEIADKTTLKDRMRERERKERRRKTLTDIK